MGRVNLRSKAIRSYSLSFYYLFFFLSSFLSLLLEITGNSAIVKGDPAFRNFLII